MKYIEVEKINKVIDNQIKWLKDMLKTNLLDVIEKRMILAEIRGIWKVRDIINKIKQEEPTPPGIEEESQKKGWLDYGLTISEIGLHRYNAINRIKEHKKQFNPQAVPDLYHVAEYYKAVGVELTCCCLQAYCKDFIFTKEEVKKIIEEES